MTAHQQAGTATPRVWFSEHSENEMRRMYAESGEDGVPKRETFEQWADAEGYMVLAHILRSVTVREIAAAIIKTHEAYQLEHNP